MPPDCACAGASVGSGAAVAVGANTAGTGAVAAFTAVAEADGGVCVAVAVIGSLVGAIGVGGADAGVSVAADCAVLATFGAAIDVSVVDAVGALSLLGNPLSAPPSSAHPPISGTNSKTKTAAAKRQAIR